MMTKLDLNKPTQIYCKFHIPKLENNNFRNFKKFGGGCFEDMSPYAAYLINIFFKSKTYSIKTPAAVKVSKADKFDSLFEEEDDDLPF